MPLGGYRGAEIKQSVISHIMYYFENLMLTYIPSLTLQIGKNLALLGGFSTYIICDFVGDYFFNAL